MPIVKAKEGKVFAIGGSLDHIHLLALLTPEISISTLIGHVKACSSKWFKSREAVDPQYLYNRLINVVSNSRGIVHAIGGIEDHVHILMEIPKDKALSDLVRDIKTTATHWIKGEERSRYRDFEWQTGYGAFTMSYLSIEAVKRYIDQQEEHHSQQSSVGEWNDFLLKRGNSFLV